MESQSIVENDAENSETRLLCLKTSAILSGDHGKTKAVARKAAGRRKVKESGRELFAPDPGIKTSPVPEMAKPARGRYEIVKYPVHRLTRVVDNVSNRYTNKVCGNHNKVNTPFKV